MQPFRTYLPVPELRPYVKLYLVLESDFGDGLTMDAVPRGLPVLGFSFRPDQAIQWTKKEGKPSLGKSTLLGQTTRTVSCLMHGVHQTIYAVFQPTGLHPFVRHDMQTFTDEECALDDMPWIAREHNLPEQLSQAITDTERIGLIETLLIKRLHQVHCWADHTGEVIRLIDASNGNLRIEDVAAYFRISRRSLERHFLEHVGLNPKHYANIMRFRYVMSYLHDNPGASWLDLTHLGNFADQSHLIRHFRGFTNLSPAAFLTRDHQLDKLFLEMT